MRLNNLLRRIVGGRRKKRRSHPFWIRNIIDRVTPYTMTSVDRIAALCHAVEHIVKENISGSIVECGVWKGGSMMAAALALKHLGQTDRRLYLFDTFEGMSPPTDRDVFVSTRRSAQQLLREEKKDSLFWAVSPLDEVRANLQSVHYPQDRIIFVKGLVENTIPDPRLNEIAILRLDTDWYESTKHELIHLYPLIASGGALIIDDYGDWEGARQAVDEYFAANNLAFDLKEIDHTGRIAFKSY